MKSITHSQPDTDFLNTLQTADVVIIYDSDWNPQMDLQAQEYVRTAWKDNRGIEVLPSCSLQRL
jgi:hypothetical protein